MKNIRKIVLALVGPAVFAITPATWAAGTGYLFVSSEKDHAITVLDGESYEIVKQIRTAARPRHLAFSPDRSRLYAACGEGNAIDIIDVASLELVDRIGPIEDPEAFDFSPDGETFYFADTRRNAIFAYDYDTQTGAIGPERVAVDTAPWGSGPDGGTVDSEGFLWSALVHAGKIARFAPDGSLDRLIDMPCSRPASVMFGGPDLDILFVPSIRDSGNVRGDREIDGALFAVHDLGITGIPEPRFAG